MRKQKMCENKKAKINICENHENENLVENLDFDRMQKTSAN